MSDLYNGFRMAGLQHVFKKSLYNFSEVNEHGQPIDTNHLLDDSGDHLLDDSGDFLAVEVTPVFKTVAILDDSGGDLLDDSGASLSTFDNK